MIASLLNLLKILAFFSFSTLISADYIRYSIVNITSIEPREWDTDNLMTTLNIVSQTQNVTQAYTFGKWPRGRSGVTNSLYKDVPLTGTEPVVTVSFALYNVGDKDPQKYGLSKYLRSLSL